MSTRALVNIGLSYSNLGLNHLYVFIFSENGQQRKEEKIF